VAVGEGVSRVKVGDRVASIFMQTWLAGELTETKAKSALGGGTSGMLAEYVLLREDGLVHVQNTSLTKRPPHCPAQQSLPGTLLSRAA